MRLIKQLLVTLVFLPEALVARCLPAPNHVFVMEINVCRTLYIGGTTQPLEVNGVLISTNSMADDVNGYLVQGQILEDSYDWGEALPHQSYQPWKVGDFQSVFVQNKIEKLCLEKLPVTATFIEDPVCCDISPDNAKCLVGHTKAKIQ